MYYNPKSTPHPSAHRPSPLDLESGGPMPCSRGITSNGDSNPIHCMIEGGWNH
jgi:hypothetical protein